MGLFARRPRDPARHKIAKFEGWWTVDPESPHGRVFGKIEWDAFESGDSEIDLFVQVLDLPDGDVVDVMWGDQVVTSVTVRKGTISRDLETKDGDEVPRLADQHVELRYRGAVLARTHLVPD